ncbi:MAG: hypothetical protein KIT14_01495 [bacterium]|nr:hypothetical protein [bacterium]
MRRRTFLRLATVSSAVVATRAWPAAAASGGGSDGRWGRWVVRGGLPAFVYLADQEAVPEAEWDPIAAPRTRRHWVMLGNRALSMQVANDGGVAVFDERHGLRWLTAPDPTGTGVSVLDDAGVRWGSAFADRAGASPSRRTFGPTWFMVEDARDGLALERTVLLPDGDVPWLLVRVRLTLARGARGPRTLRHVERWALRPRFLNLLESEAQRRTRAGLAVSYEVAPTAAGLVARERFATPGTPGPAGAAAAFLIGPPATLVLERLGATAGTSRLVPDTPHPTLEIETPLALGPGDARELWFRFGHADAAPMGPPRRLFATSLRALARRLPAARARRAPEARREVPWHAALLTGGLGVDRVIGGHTLDQASAYSFLLGFNGAARDPLQHALPLCYLEPDLALSVLRNTSAWATPDGDLPYALDGAKRPTNIIFRPSDQNLWALWLAAEYAAATGDLAAFDAPLAYHPARSTPAVPLREHLRRQFRFFVDGVGRGERGHVRILNADWNDVAIAESGVDPAVMIEHGGSVLNSAMAAWVLPVFAALAERLGEAALAAEARAQADALRDLVRQAWNGRWFHRAYAPGVPPVGEDDCWLEVQPWAILCGAADADQARALLATIDAGNRVRSPLGARVRWPPSPEQLANGTFGEATSGGIWYAISMTLVWAAARVDPALGWDEWRRQSLASHTAAYPDVWEGTLSGPDSWNAPESRRPGRTWGTPALSMQAFPVNNLHSHAQPLLGYLRLLGVEPTARGTLAVGRGGRFASRTFRVAATGRGRMEARGPVTLETSHGRVSGSGPGPVRW